MQANIFAAIKQKIGFCRRTTPRHVTNKSTILFEILLLALFLYGTTQSKAFFSTSIIC